jgi:hypothetical protein
MAPVLCSWKQGLGLSRPLGPRTKGGLVRGASIPCRRRGATSGLQVISSAAFGSKTKSQIHSVCDSESSLECAGLQNRSSPGHESSSCRASLRSQFHLSEGATCGSAQLCLTRLVPASEGKSTPSVRPLSERGNVVSGRPFRSIAAGMGFLARTTGSGR